MAPPLAGTPAAGPAADGTIAVAPSRGGWPVVLSVAAVFFLTIAARSVFGPLLPAIEVDLAVGHAQAGSLFLVMTVGYGAGLLCSGPLCRRLSPRAVIALSSAVIGATLLALAALGTFAVLGAGMAVLGFAAGLYLPAGIGAITAAVSPPRWGTALALHELAPNLAFAVTPLVAEALLAHLSWRGVIAVFGLAPLAAGLAGPLLPRMGGTVAPLSTAPAPPRARVLAFWTLVALAGLGTGLNIGVLTMLPLYLAAELGLERVAANHLVALSRVLPCLTLLGAGWFADRVGPRRALTVALCVSAATTAALGLVPRAAVPAAVLLQPMVTAWIFPALFALLSALGPRSVALASPLAMIVGGGLVPAAIGAFAERGHFRWAFVLLGGISLAGALAAPILEAAWAPGARRPPHAAP